MKESLMYGLLGGMIGSWCWGMGAGMCGGMFFSPAPGLHSCACPPLATADMNALIAQKSLRLAKALAAEGPGRSGASSLSASPSGPLSAARLREIGERLREDLNAFAAKRNLLLLSAGAVAGGSLPNKTKEILEEMEKGEGS